MNHQKYTQGFPCPGCHHQNDFYPPADIGYANTRTSGATLAVFYARGVTPASYVQAAPWAHTTESLFKALHAQAAPSN
ncbi:MAG: hypothetical protein Q7U74_09145 [Saprospiraceae bacterium]|nr:hypothetical protein [Saprospiraceae bacterium]